MQHSLELHACLCDTHVFDCVFCGVQLQDRSQLYMYYTKTSHPQEEGDTYHGGLSYDRASATALSPSCYCCELHMLSTATVTAISDNSDNYH